MKYDYVVEMNSFPSKNSKEEISSEANAALFTVASSTGHFQLISKSGKIEKEISAHTGTITNIKWNHDGTAFATAGEDGILKVLRTTLKPCNCFLLFYLLKNMREKEERACTTQSALFSHLMLRK